MRGKLGLTHCYLAEGKRQVQKKDKGRKRKWKKREGKAWVL